jgi:DivIVA domain-containing protein
MTDETFHLTPLDVRRYDFRTALRGYEREHVDQFREQVATELERLGRLNADLETKVRAFAEQLGSFRERDSALNDALVSAQKFRAEIREQAEKESELILREARVEAARIIDGARANVRSIEEEFASIERMRRGYLAQLRMHVERQLADITAAESMNAGEDGAAAGRRSVNGGPGSQG